MQTSNQEISMYKRGDIIVGSNDPGKSAFSATGAPLIENAVSIYGNDNSLKELRESMITSIERNGGKPVSLTTPDKPGKKTKKYSKKTSAEKSSISPVVEYTPLNELRPVEPKKLKTVIFENAFGRMRAKVENIVEHDMAFLLVFSDEESVVFEPKIGESLTFYDDSNESYEVYYPGVTFSWPDDTKKFMILFKIPEGN